MPSSCSINESYKQNRKTAKRSNQGLALAYKRTTPNNVIQAKSNILNIINQTTILGSRYIVRIISNSSHPVNKILEEFCEVYQT